MKHRADIESIVSFVTNAADLALPRTARLGRYAGAEAGLGPTRPARARYRPLPSQPGRSGWLGLLIRQSRFGLGRRPNFWAML